jgi:hypothetical protein
VVGQSALDEAVYDRHVGLTFEDEPLTDAVTMFCEDGPVDYIEPECETTGVLMVCRAHWLRVHEHFPMKREPKNKAIFPAPRKRVSA